MTDSSPQSPQTPPSPQTAPSPGSAPSPESAEKPVEQWATGSEPATGPQLSYLSTLAREAGRDVPESLTKADASILIDELQKASGRGV